MIKRICTRLYEVGLSVYVGVIIYFKNYRINRFNILHITRDDVKHLVFVKDKNRKFVKARELGRVKDGDWDLEVVDIRDLDFANFFKERIDQQLALEATSYYNIKLTRSLRKPEKYGFTPNTSPEVITNTIIERLNRYENLFYAIRENGYKPNKQVHKKYRLDEICFRIGRNGEFLFDDGRHRLSIALYLNIPIPVLITWRHKNWIKYRNYFMQLSTNIQAEISPVFTHPDIPGLEVKKDAEYPVFRALNNSGFAAQDKLILDVGARTGQSSVYLARNNRVHSLEFRKPYFEIISQLRNILQLKIASFDLEGLLVQFTLRYDYIFISDNEYFNNDDFYQRLMIIFRFTHTKGLCYVQTYEVMDKASQMAHALGLGNKKEILAGQDVFVIWEAGQKSADEV